MAGYFCDLPLLRRPHVDIFHFILIPSLLTIIALSETVAESQGDVAFYQTARLRDDVMTSRASLYTFKVNLIIYFVNKYTTQWPSHGGKVTRTWQQQI